MLKNWGVKMLCMGLISILTLVIHGLCQGDPIADMQTVNTVARDSAGSLMQSSADRAGIPIELVGLSLTSTMGEMIVLAPVVHPPGSLTKEALEAGANVMYAFLELPSRLNIPKSYYTVWVYKDMGWKATLIDSEGNEFGPFDADVGEDAEREGDPEAAGDRAEESQRKTSAWPGDVISIHYHYHYHLSVGDFYDYWYWLWVWVHFR